MLKLSNLESIGKPVYKFHNLHSVDFDGVDDFIELGEPISYTQHTISTWVKVGNNDANSTIIDARDADDDGIRLRATTDEKIIYSLNTSDLTSTNSFVDEWVHIVATYDGTTQKLYINGALDKSATTTQEVSVTTNAKIGARNFSDRANEFLGKIDELAIYDRALTAAEVTQIYRIKYGANLVQNGNFDELGSELVTDGGFTDASNWNLTIGTPTVSGGTGNFPNETNSFIIQSSVVDTTVKTYKLQYEVVESNAGTLRLAGGNSAFGTISLTNTVGVHTKYITSNGSKTSLQFNNGSSFIGKIDNVSLKQVDPNDRWTLGTGWAYGDSKIVATNASGTFCTQAGILTSGKIYKVSFTVQNLTQGRVRFRSAGVNGTTRTANGTYTELITVNGAAFSIQGLTDDGGFTGEVVNIMAEEQKYVATNLKLNSGNYKSADPVIVSTKSVDFDGVEEHLDLGTQSATSSLTYSAWVKVTDTDASTILSYGNTLLRLGTATSIQFWSDVSEPQLSTSVSTLTNVWSHIVVTQTGQNVKIYLNGVQVNSTSSNPPVNTGANISSIGRYAQGDLWYFTGQIDDVGIFNVSLSSDQVIELYNQGVPSNLSTHSANANLIGYWKMGDGTLDEAPLIADQTNATLGSELVTNGDYSTDSDWNKLNGSTISGGVGKVIANGALSSTGNNWSLNQNVGMAIGKTYKITFRARQTVGTGNFQVGQGYKIGFNQTITSSFADYVFYIVAADWSGSVLTGSITIGGLTVNDEFEIDDVSVKQVNGNPALMQNTPTIVTDAPLTKIRNYYRMGDGLLDKHQADNITLYSTRGLICDMIEPSLGTELLTDGDFPAGTSAWTLGTGWSLEAGACVREGASSNTNFSQSISVTANKVYQISYTRIYVSGTRTTNLFSDFETDGTSITLGDYRGTEETVTVVSFFMPTYTGTVPIRVFGINDWSGKITNVSVKEVNGVGGLMTNMLNTDITNDVPS